MEYYYVIFRHDSENNRFKEMTPMLKGGSINETRKNALAYLKAHRMPIGGKYDYFAEIYTDKKETKSADYGRVYYDSEGMWFVSVRTKNIEASINYAVRPSGALNTSERRYEY